MDETTVDREKLRQKALTLLSGAGVPLNLRRNKMWFDGKAIAAGKKIPVDDMLHEGAHWLMAHPSRRGWVNYGLGTDPNGDTPERFRGLECTDRQIMEAGVDEEVMASGAGILMVAAIGGDYDKVLRNHQWNTQADGEKDMVKARQRLRAVGVNVPRRAYEKVQATLKTLLMWYGQPDIQADEDRRPFRDRRG